MPQHMLTFVHISDTHLAHDPDFKARKPRPARDAALDLLDRINKLEGRVQLVLHTGDIVDHPRTEKHYAAAREVMQVCKQPMLYVPGNHDDVRMFQRDFLGIEPKAHADHETEINGVQILLLDSHAPQNTELQSAGFLADEQLAWVEERCLAKDRRPLIVAVHHHPIKLGAPWIDRMVLRNGLDLHNILKQARHRLRGVFHGHIHEGISVQRDGVMYYSVQSSFFQTRTWYGQTHPANDYFKGPGFNLVTLTTHETFVRFRRLPLAKLPDEKR